MSNRLNHVRLDLSQWRKPSTWYFIVALVSFVGIGFALEYGKIGFAFICAVLVFVFMSATMTAHNKEKAEAELRKRTCGHG